MPFIPPLKSSAVPAAVIVVAVLLAAGFFNGLTRSNDSAAERVTESAIEQNNLGVAYMNQYLFNEASAAFRKAVAAEPNFNLARINLGIALFYKQDYDEAAALLQDALGRDAKNPYAYYTLGLILKNKGEQEKAAESFQRATELDPKDPASFYNLGVLNARLRKNAEAEAALKRCLELDPTNTSAMYNLGTFYLKSGRAREGNSLLERFRTLQQKGDAGAGMGIGNQYGEMGAYALTLDYKPSFAPSIITPRPPNTLAPFTDRTAEAGLSSLEPGSGETPSLPNAVPSREWFEILKTRWLPDLGGGIALSDLDNDGDVDLVVTRFHLGLRTWQILILLNDGKGHFTDVTASSGVQNSGTQISAAIGDYDNDGLPDIYLVGLGGNRLFRNLGHAKFEDVSQAANVTDGGLCVSATFVDYDHDGDLDLYVCHYADVSRPPEGNRITFPGSLPGQPNRMYRNNGNGTFTEFADALGVGAGKHHHLGMIPTDLDNDRDIDLVVVNEDAPPQVFTNDRNDHFTEITPRALAGITGLFRSLAVADFNRDGAMDFFLSPGRRGQNLLLLNRGDGTLASDTRSPDLAQALSGFPRYGVGTLDYDNDGDLDLYLFPREEGRRGELWENAGDGRLVFAGQLTESSAGRGAAAADLDGDGRVDILYLNRTFSPRFLKNESKSSKHWVGTRLEGLRSNKAGLGAKVEVRAGSLYQKFEIQGHNGYLSQDTPLVWIGLGDATKVDSITVRWPSGIVQSEINIATGKIALVKELDRKGTSCPLLYTFNGKSFEFVTDFLGGCAIGYLEAPGQYSIPDTDEYVRIEGRQLVARDGKYLLHLNNQLEEVIMFDQAQLMVVDHPALTEIYPNERLMPQPPFAEFKIYTTRNPRTPRSAVDQTGKDILPLIARKDRVYPTSFRSLPYKGYAETHSITLDLGDLAAAKKVVLLMDAWIDYADSTSNLGASQAGIAQIPPYLQVRDSAGKWRTVIRSMGFPAGQPKTMTVDLNGKFLSNDHHVRIVTNMKIYWDRIRVDTSEDVEVRVTRLDPTSADLHFRGYPAYYMPDGKLPWIYDYSRIATSELWGTHAGAYTRFGDVLELMLKKDDKFVITRHGDEISLAFDASRVPALPKGWVRDYLFYADGYGKDMDINSLYPEVMGPLPFHGMSKFPYPPSEKYPDDEEHRNYRKDYNTRVFPVRTPKLPTTGR